jgi:hypothetical protein
MINWTPVYGSSNVMAMAYDPDARECYVKFHPIGEIYVYMGVSQRTWNEFVNAPSKGRFVQLELRRSFSAQKLSASEATIRMLGTGAGYEGAEEEQ